MLKKLLLLFLTIYKNFISIAFRVLFGDACRFTPTCSVYARVAIEKKGALIGTYMAIKRILRCNPLSKGGYDPV